jgi:hypothetical protein
MLPVTFRGLVILGVTMIVAVIIGVMLSGYGNCCDVGR